MYLALCVCVCLGLLHLCTCGCERVGAGEFLRLVNRQSRVAIVILDYRPIKVMLKHSWWSRWSPQPPFPLRSLVFLMTLATIREIDLGYSWRERRATRSTCCTLDITWLDSQLLFLWWTPHSPMWKTLGPFTTITCSFCFKHCCDTCCKDQSQL